MFLEIWSDDCEYFLSYSLVRRKEGKGNKYKNEYKHFRLTAMDRKMRNLTELDGSEIEIDNNLSTLIPSKGLREGQK